MIFVHSNKVSRGCGMPVLDLFSRKSVQSYNFFCICARIFVILHPIL